MKSILLKRKWKRRNRKQEMENRNSHFPFSNSQFALVSIVVTTKNEEKNIATCLESIKNQSLNSHFPIPISFIEIIVVDNNSSDNTVKIARKFTDKVYNKGPERSAQRNYGVKKAKGKYILYLDADMILSKKVIEECVNKCEKAECIALYIPERIVDNIKCLPQEMPKAISWGTKVRDFERSFYNATYIDAVRFVKRDESLKVGGFDESFFVAEDWDFDRRIRAKGKVGIIDVPLYHNEGIFSLKRYLQKKVYYSKNLDRYIEKWEENDRTIKKQLGFSYRFFGVFVENGKWKRLLRHPILTLGMYFLRGMVGIRYLIRK